VHTQAVEAAGSGKWKMENRSRGPGRKGSPNAVEATTIVHLNAVWGPRARQHISLGGKKQNYAKTKNNPRKRSRTHKNVNTFRSTEGEAVVFRIFRVRCCQNLWEMWS